MTQKNNSNETRYTVSGDFQDLEYIHESTRSLESLLIKRPDECCKGPIDDFSLTLRTGISDINKFFLNKKVALTLCAPPPWLTVQKPLWTNMQENCLRADALMRVFPSYFYDHRDNGAFSEKADSYPAYDLFPSMFLFRFLFATLLDWKKIYIAYMILASFRIGVMWKDRRDSCNMTIEKSDIYALADTLKDVVITEEAAAKCYTSSGLTLTINLEQDALAKMVADELTRKAIIRGSNSTGNWVFYHIPLTFSECDGLSRYLLNPDKTINYSYYDELILRNAFGEG